jgi:hypothetical protein
MDQLEWFPSPFAQIYLIAIEVNVDTNRSPPIHAIAQYKPILIGAIKYISKPEF